MNSKYFSNFINQTQNAAGEHWSGGISIFICLFCTQSFDLMTTGGAITGIPPAPPIKGPTPAIVSLLLGISLFPVYFLLDESSLIHKTLPCQNLSSVCLLRRLIL
jgi:hypothetical protein